MSLSLKAWMVSPFEFTLIIVAIDCTTFHEPHSILHKVEKALMLETDVPETPNEMIFLARKFGRIGLIGVYAGYTNHFAIGSLMEKGIRFIGNGQAPVSEVEIELISGPPLLGGIA
jgi:threonine dehydrogenase-like Zn-dependent dehydrogenase